MIFPNAVDDSLNVAVVNEYIGHASSLYHLLLDSVSLQEGTKCMIVPDGVLNYISIWCPVDVISENCA